MSLGRAEGTPSGARRVRVLVGILLAIGGLAVAGFAAFAALPAAFGLVGAAIVLVAGLLLRNPGAPAPILSRTPDNALALQDDAVARLAAAIPNPTIVLARDGTVIAFNAKAAVLAPALARGELASFALRVPAVVEAVRRAGATGDTQRAEFSERVPVDRWYEVSVVPFALTPRPGQLLCLTFHDLTPLRQVEEMRADFVANASHELRTPLASLSGFVDTLLGPAREDAAARERFLVIMRAQAQRMARLIDDLLSLSRIEINAHIPPEGVVDVAGAVRQVIDGLQMLAHERAVEVKLSGETALRVTGDRDELIRVFENLIENALKYGGSGKCIEVTISAAAAAGVGEARIAVRDFGPGIETQHLSRLTERFYRVDVGQSRAEGGTGLGLALVKHILNRHRGRLSIESVVGEGSTFTVHLPLASMPAQAATGT